MLHTLSIREPEIAKYRELWSEVPAYRATSPGTQFVGPFLALTGLQPGARIVDLGCGTGRAGQQLARLAMRVTLLDATRDALDEGVLDDCDFVEACAWDPWPAVVGPQDAVLCCDLLEHIPIEFTMVVVLRCLEAAPLAFFHIAFDPDLFGHAIGRSLHVTQQPFVWWRDRLAEVGTLTEARDLLGSGLFLLERRT